MLFAGGGVDGGAHLGDGVGGESALHGVLAAEARAAGPDLPEGEYEDIPQLTEEQPSRLVCMREVRRKAPVSVRLDPQVLDWLRSKGEGHLTRINNILTNLMEAEQRAGKRRS